MTWTLVLCLLLYQTPAVIGLVLGLVSWVSVFFFFFFRVRYDGCVD